MSFFLLWTVVVSAVMTTPDGQPQSTVAPAPVEVHLYPKFWRGHSEKWIGPKQYDELDLDGLKQELRQHLDRLVNEKLPAIEGALASLSAETFV